MRNTKKDNRKKSNGKGHNGNKTPSNSSQDSITESEVSEDSQVSDSESSENYQKFKQPRPQSMVINEAGAYLTWKDIHYEVRSKTKICSCSKPEEEVVSFKKILKGITGQVSPCEMLGILGPSGAGKTSFLNILSRRIKNSSKKKITGSIIINGHQASHAYFKKISAFVAQEDILMGSMTPWEALCFTASLSLGEKFTKEEKEQKVFDLLENMGLLEVRNNFIGFVGTGSLTSGIERGLSGGERKRVSICVELMHNPQLIFMDEPTSGLDSFAAKTVITCLRNLADQGKTIICTIHQPAAELLRMFDKLLILGSGNTIFFGRTKDAPYYFKLINHPIPKFCNPADHYIKVVQLGGKEKESLLDIENGDGGGGANLKNAVFDHTAMAEQFRKSKYGTINKTIDVQSLDKTIDGDFEVKKTSCFAGADAEYTHERASFGLQMSELLKRSLNFTFREPLLFKVRFFQTLFMGVLAGLIFLQIPNTLTGASNKISGGFFVAINPLFSGINGPTTTFPPERAVFWRENGGGLYSAGAYYLSKLIAEVPVNVLNPIAFGAIAWWMMNLNPLASRFFIFLLIEIILTTLGYGIGIVLNLVIYDPGIVQRIQPLIILPLMIFAGFFINTNSIPIWLIWLEAISPLKYAFRGAMNVILGGESYYCESGDLRGINFVSVPFNSTLDSNVTILSSTTTSALICPVTNGDQLLDQLGILGYDIWIDIIILAAMSLFFYILAFILLVVRKPRF